jgi:hypothetical protein
MRSLALDPLLKFALVSPLAIVLCFLAPGSCCAASLIRIESCN